MFRRGAVAINPQAAAVQGLLFGVACAHFYFAGREQLLCVDLLC